MWSNPLPRLAIGIWSLVILALFLAGSARADGPHRAGVVVSFGDGRTRSACVSFAEDSISGIELLRRAGFSLITGYAGAGVCKIDDLGCPSDNCFCQSFAPPYAYWAYFHLGGDGNWSYAQTGAASYRVQDGQVDGWSWGPGESVPPPRLRFEQICVAPTATPTAALTATSTPPPPSPTRPPPTATPPPATPTPNPPTATAPPTQTPPVPTATVLVATATDTPRNGTATATRRPATATSRPTSQPSPGATLMPVLATPRLVISATPTASPSPTTPAVPTATPLPETVTPAQPPAAPVAVAPSASPAGQPLAYGVFVVIAVALVSLLLARSRLSR